MLSVPITAVGISHHLVALEELAELSRVAEPATAALDADPRLLGRVVLSTCNRFEVYFESDSFHSSLEAVLATISAALPPASRDIVDQFEISVCNSFAVVARSRTVICKPAFSKRLAISGSFTISLISLLSFASTASGVPAGAKKPVHDPAGGPG